uniref:DNA polymerase sliding clamp n=1 Tax=Ignisphaera aggregans TaxID=334771 RepID=A0A7J3QF00_9CREN
MSIRVVYPVGVVFKKVTIALKSVVDQIPLVISSDRFSIEALSPDKVSMVVFELPATSFEEFNVSGEVRVVADRDEFVKAFRRASKRDKVEITYIEGSRELNIKVFNIRSNIEREYFVPLSEISFESIGSIDVELEVSASLSSSELINILKDASLVGDEITLLYSSENNYIKVVATSELTAYETTLKQFQPLTYLESSISNAVAKYSVEHLKALLKILDLADECSIAFGPEKPLKISLDIGGGGRVTIWVAPRV